MNSSEICQKCGICCSGLIAGYVKLTPRERQHFKIEGIRQPCSYLKDLRCTTYGSRPEVCRDFKCDLLKKYEAGEVSLNQVTTEIDGILKLDRDLRRILKLSKSENLWDVIEKKVKEMNLPENLEEEVWQKIGMLYLGVLQVYSSLKVSYPQSSDEVQVR